MCIRDRFKGQRLFIPASHVELNRTENLAKYKGPTMEVKVIEFAKERGRLKIVGSRREILAKENEALKEETWAHLETGNTVEAVSYTHLSWINHWL